MTRDIVDRQVRRFMEKRHDERESLVCQYLKANPDADPTSLTLVEQTGVGRDGPLVKFWIGDRHSVGKLEQIQELVKQQRQYPSTAEALLKRLVDILSGAVEKTDE